jgi:hypothetical protein
MSNPEGVRDLRVLQRGRAVKYQKLKQTRQTVPVLASRLREALRTGRGMSAVEAEVAGRKVRVQCLETLRVVVITRDEYEAEFGESPMDYSRKVYACNERFWKAQRRARDVVKNRERK